MRASFAELLRSKRLARGWSQQELGQRAGVDRTAIGHLEKGIRQPIWQTVQRLALALSEGCETFRDLFDVPGEEAVPAKKPPGRPRAKKSPVKRKPRKK